MIAENLYRVVTTKPMNLLSQRPEIQGFVVDSGYRDARVALLLVKPVQLLEEVDLGARCGLDGVQTLQTSLESERLRTKN